MMGREPIHIAEGQLISSLASAPLPYMLGILPSATVLALVSYPLTLIFWDLIHSRLEAARKRKAQRALHDALPKKLLESAEPDGH
jgi:hypothetical protein